MISRWFVLQIQRKGHRRMKSGKVVYVNPYNNKVTATVQDSGKQLSLFANNNYVDESQTDKYATIKKTEKKENKEQNIDPRKLLQTWYFLGKRLLSIFKRNFYTSTYTG